ncbi:MAG: beta-phosphoglucomutase family hydrolase [Chlorobiaceae bacterium]|nr:beta-phosphoglucomutase family hydrolase [Chlorobiaceae bacterium]
MSLLITPPAIGCKAFIFDMDGVLIDNMKMHAQSWVNLFSDYGLQGLDPDRYLVETAGMKGLDVLRYFLDPSISVEDAERLTELKDILYRVMNRDAILPMPGLAEFLDRAFTNGIRLGIGTGAGPKNIAYILELLDMESRFQAIVGAHQVSHGKPHPETFLKAAQLLGAEPASCIVFEDALPGVEAAAAAGMSCIAVTTTNRPDAFAHFDNVIKTIDDFAGLRPEELHALSDSVKTMS